MPLTREHVTAASRIMLPTYPVFLLVVGLNLTFTSDARLLASPGLSYAARSFDLTFWGIGFLTVALVLAAALLVHRRHWYQVGLGVAISWLLIWTGVLALAALNGGASPTAWVWPAFIARACWASLVSLEVGER